MLTQVCLVLDDVFDGAVVKLIRAPARHVRVGHAEY